MKYKERSNNYSIRAVSPAHQEAELTIIMKGIDKQEREELTQLLKKTKRG